MGLRGFGVCVYVGGWRPFPFRVQTTDAADGGAPSELLPETELPVSQLLRTTGLDSIA